MDPKRVRAIFDTALTLPLADRHAFVETETQGDPRLRLEVLSLLGSQNQEPESTLFGGRYRKIEHLGSGGFGDVYRAADERLGGRNVVVKVPHLHTLSASQRWFEQKAETEMRALARVDYPGIVGILDFQESDDGSVFLVMQYVPGPTLRELMIGEPLPRERVVRILEHLAGALAAAHAAGIVHRDLKPENIIVRDPGTTSERAVVIDFGIASLLDASAMRHTIVSGTPAYMAPEVFDGVVSAAVDVWAFGVLASELLTGKRATFPEEARAAIPGPGGEFIASCLQRDPAARPAFPLQHGGREISELLRPAETQRKGPLRILVLPFRSLREDPETSFLCESLPEAIICELAGFKTVQVCSSVVAKRYAAAIPDIPLISRQTQVDALTTGTLLRIGPQIRVTTETLSVPSGEVLSTCSFRGKLDDLFDLQDQAVREIIRGLQLQQDAGGARDTPKSNAAYELYLRGNLVAPGPAGKIAEARDLYLECVRTDPNYAPAWARLSRCYRVLAKYWGDRDANIRMSREAAEKALALSPELDVAWSQLVQLHTDSGRPLEALELLLRRLAQSPNSVDLLTALTYVCRFCGLFEQSIGAHLRARQIDPTASTSVTHTYFAAGQNLSSLETRTQDVGYVDLVTLQQMGLPDEAAQRAQARLEQGNLTPLGHYLIRAVLLALRRDRVALSETFAEASANLYLGPEEEGCFGRLLILGGEVAAGFEAMDHAVRRGYWITPALAADAWFDPVRGDSRWTSLIEFATVQTARARIRFLELGGPGYVSTASR